MVAKQRCHLQRAEKKKTKDPAKKRGCHAMLLLVGTATFFLLKTMTEISLNLYLFPNTWTTHLRDT